MKVGYTFFASAAEVSPDHKLSVLGADFDSVVGRFPVTLPPLSLVVKLTFAPEEGNRTYQFRVEIIGPTGNVVGQAAQTDVTAPIPREPNPLESKLIVILMINGLELERAGTYTARILMDQSELATVKLFAVERPSHENITSVVP